MEYTFKTKQMMKVSEKIGNFYELEKAVFENDIGKLAKLISIFGDVAEDKALDYIDEQLDSGRKIADLYDEIFKVINEKGFFNQVLEVNLQTLPVDMNKLTQEMYEKYMNKEIEKQISKASKNM